MPAYYGGWPVSQDALDYADAWYGNGGSEPLNNGQWQVNNLRVTDAGNRLKERNQQLQSQYQDLFRADVRKDAQDMANRLAGTKDQNSISALYAQAVNGNDYFALQNGGDYGFAAGNQANKTLDDIEGRLGAGAADGLRGVAADQDFLWNLDGDQNGLKGVGSLKYNSMGISGGTHTGNTDRFAYGASAFDDNNNWNMNSGANYFEPGNIYDVRQMMRAPGNIKGAPMGTYGGPQGTGQNVRQYGDPRQNTGNNNNYQWQPPFLMPKDGPQTVTGGGAGDYQYEDYSKYGAKQSKFDINNSQYMDRSGVLKAPTADQLMAKGMGQGYTQPAYPALAQIPDPPVVKKGPSPIMGSGFSPMNPSYDVFNQSLVGKGAPQPASATFGDSAFSRYQTDPFTAGQVDARMSKYNLR